MAKLKEVRALKASGVEPLAPTLIKRILHNLVLKAEDRRWAFGELRALRRRDVFRLDVSFAPTGLGADCPILPIIGQPSDELSDSAADG